MAEYSEELKIAKKAAGKASEIIKEFRDNHNFEINFKGKNDLVTDADLAAEEMILSIIRDAFPDDRILAEESSTQKVLPEERTWLVDPIDGTTNFAHGFPVFCVSIALWEKQEARMGLILEVNKQEYFHAIKGKGAYLNNDPIHVSSIEDSQYSMIGTGFPYNDLSLLQNYLRIFEWLLHRTQGVRRPGAASYDLCCVAAGRFDGFYEYALNPWDVGAAGLLVQEAGGKVTDWQGGSNWLFGRRIVAGNPEIHDFLIKAIREHFTEAEIKG
ncbi:inositol monophosphatase [Balneolaceae bacterium YR4-1]|uniref:Inositol-1-monophosphatase n=1 Tax=Halalkalibaculum roseum TaxID=2709311 RepID=A0A6M1SY26_9BACT|nr:inositol monophosphatase family protein [Halalkalibaculum roseum]NGP76054.1 inositol monophosphatase [Halalkalibaculum roseum]